MSNKRRGIPVNLRPLIASHMTAEDWDELLRQWQVMERQYSELEVTYAKLLDALEREPGERGERYRHAFKLGAIAGLMRAVAEEEEECREAERRSSEEES